MISNDDEWWLTYWPTIFHQPFRSHWDYSISNAKYDDHPPPSLGVTMDSTSEAQKLRLILQMTEGVMPDGPRCFFWFWQCTQGSCEHFESKNTEDSKIHSASHEKHKIKRDGSTRMNHWNLAILPGFSLFLLFLGGLETTSWSSLGWSNIVWTRPGSDIELTIVI